MSWVLSVPSSHKVGLSHAAIHCKMEATSRIKHKYGQRAQCAQQAGRLDSHVTHHCCTNTSPSVHTCCQGSSTSNWWKRKMPEFDSWVGKACTWYKAKIHEGYSTAHKGVALKVREEPKSSRKHRVSGSTPCHLFMWRWPKIRIHLGSGNWHDQLAWSLKRNRLEDWAPVDLR